MQLFQRVPGSLVVRLEQAALRRSVQALADADTHSAVVFRLANPARLKQDLVVAAASGAGAYQATFADLPADESGGYTLTASLWRDIASASVLTDPGYQDPDRLVGLGSATVSIVPGESRTVALTIHAVGAPVLRYKGWVVAPDALSAGMSSLECDTGVTLAGNPLGTRLELETFLPGASSLLASASLPVASWPTSPATATFSVAVPDTTEASTSFRARLRLSGGTGPFSVRTWPLVVSRLVVSGTSPATASARTSVTLEGAGFSPVPAENAVTFGGIAADVASASATRLTVTVPSWATSDVQVRFAGVSATQSFTATAPTLYHDAGSGLAAYLNGPLLLAKFAGPSGICGDASGSVYIADTINSQIRKIGTSNTVSTFAGVQSPVGIACDSQGRVYVSLVGPVIRVYSSAASVLSTRPVNAGPAGMCLDRSDNLYVAYGSGTNKVVRYDSSGAVLATYGTGAAQSSGDGGPATAAGLVDPYGVCLDGQGNLFVTQRNAHRIRKIDTNGVITTVAGTGESGYSGDGGPATQATLN
ncbi:MAG: IPT/TIG domain-containing protein [bacterium]|nr:IPT/TIG domain-containing protein [bacterium]